MWFEAISEVAVQWKRFVQNNMRVHSKCHNPHSIRAFADNYLTSSWSKLNQITNKFCKTPRQSLRVSPLQSSVSTRSVCLLPLHSWTFGGSFSSRWPFVDFKMVRRKRKTTSQCRPTNWDNTRRYKICILFTRFRFRLEIRARASPLHCQSISKRCISPFISSSSSSSFSLLQLLQCFFPFHLKCMILQSILRLCVCEREWVLVGHFRMHYPSAWRRMKQANGEVNKRRGEAKGLKCRRWKF